MCKVTQCPWTAIVISKSYMTLTDGTRLGEGVQRKIGSWQQEVAAVDS